MATAATDVLALFDDIAAFLDAVLTEVQDSPYSPMTHFSAEEVEEARFTIIRLLKSSVRLTIDGGLVDEVGRAVKIL